MAGLLRIVETGAIAMVQDLGRFGHAGIGVSESGAADRLSLRIGNRLLGNPDVCAAIEGTLVGPTIEVVESADGGMVRLAITGGSVHAEIETPTGRRPAPMWRAFELPVGARLILGRVEHGCRVYVAAAGGIETPMTLGSRSVHLATGIGGRAVSAGATVPIGQHRGAGGNAAFDDNERADMIELIRSLWSEELRYTSAPGDETAASAGTAWHEHAFRVGRDSDRIGIRLEHAGITMPRSDGAAASEPTMYGSIQATPEQLIVLGPDAAPTGGYPTIAHVIAADLDSLGQKRPGDVIRFAQLTRDEAWRRLREREARLDALLPRIGSDCNNPA